MNFFDIIKSIYGKTKLDIKVDRNLCILLNRWLSYDKRNLQYLRELVSKEFHTRISPKHYFVLLFLGIHPGRTPFLGKITKRTYKEDKLFEKIRYVLGWTKRELQDSKNILDKVIDRQYWENELGLK